VTPLRHLRHHVLLKQNNNFRRYSDSSSKAEGKYCSEGTRNHHSKETGKEIKSHRLKGNSRVNLTQPSSQRRDNVDKVAKGLVQPSFKYLQDRRFHQPSGHLFHHLMTIVVNFCFFLLPTFTWNFTYSNLCPLLVILPLCTSENGLSLSSLHSFTGSYT